MEKSLLSFLKYYVENTLLFPLLSQERKALRNLCLIEELFKNFSQIQIILKSITKKIRPEDFEFIIRIFKTLIKTYKLNNKQQYKSFFYLIKSGYKFSKKTSDLIRYLILIL